LLTKVQIKNAPAGAFQSMLRAVVAGNYVD